jgi:hypothetical protein
MKTITTKGGIVVSFIATTEDRYIHQKAIFFPIKQHKNDHDICEVHHNIK